MKPPNPRYYVYLVSSLPVLHFGSKPPFSFKKFLSSCADLIPEDETELLRGISLSGEAVTIKQPTLEKWHEFDRSLRNEFVKIRSGRKKIDPSRYLRGEDSDQRLYHAALHAYRSPSPIEGERSIDRERWLFLDELLLGHYFDLDTLVIYALKLLILEKWQRIDSADGALLVEAALER